MGDNFGSTYDQFRTNFRTKLVQNGVKDSIRLNILFKVEGWNLKFKTVSLVCIWSLSCSWNELEKEREKEKEKEKEK